MSWFKGLMCAKEYLHVSRTVAVLRLETGDSQQAGDAAVQKELWHHLAATHTSVSSTALGHRASGCLVWLLFW